jgi:hypothetical protein
VPSLNPVDDFIAEPAPSTDDVPTDCASLVAALNPTPFTVACPADIPSAELSNKYSPTATTVATPADAPIAELVDCAAPETYEEPLDVASDALIPLPMPAAIAIPDDNPTALFVDAPVALAVEIEDELPALLNVHAPITDELATPVLEPTDELISAPSRALIGCELNGEKPNICLPTYY